MFYVSLELCKTYLNHFKVNLLLVNPLLTGLVCGYFTLISNRHSYDARSELYAQSTIPVYGSGLKIIETEYTFGQDPENATDDKIWTSHLAKINKTMFYYLQVV